MSLEAIEFKCSICGEGYESSVDASRCERQHKGISYEGGA